MNNKYSMYLYKANQLMNLIRQLKHCFNKINDFAMID